MARYDGGWGGGQGNRGFGGGYDRGFGGGDRGLGGGFDREMRGGPMWQDQGESQARGVYGPARYGLGPYYERLHRHKRSDEELREEVEEALFYDTWVDAEAIEVEVNDGVVTLRGDLPDYDEIRYATDDAWDVDGVRGVRSELRIREG